MTLVYLLEKNMAGKLAILALALSICNVQSQSISCCSPSSSGQSSCGCGPSQSKSISGLTASPQLQFVPGQSCNLQAFPLSQFLSQSQGSNLQKPQAAVSVPKQSIQVSSIPQVPSSSAQCTQSCSPQVISAPVSTITIPPTTCTTIIDNSLSNSLANALQMMIANDFINSAISNNIINQDCISIPVVETSVPSYDLSSFIKNLNANQLSSCECQTSTIQCYEPEQTNSYDWEKLLSYLNEDKKKPEPTPDNSFDSLFKYLKEKGQTADQITKQPCEVPSYSPCIESDSEKALLQAITAYLSGNSCDTSSPGNVASVVFPEEIPAQLICNYGYMPTTVPVVSFTVQPVGDPNCNYIVGSQACSF